MEEELENAELDFVALRNEADNLFENGKYQEALVRYLKLYDFISNDSLIVYNIATCYSELVQYKSALKYYDLIDINEYSVKNRLHDIYFDRGLANYSDNNWKKAIYDFLEYYKIDPDSNFIFSVIGECYLYLNDYNSAIESFIKSKTDVLAVMRKHKNRDFISLMLDAEIKNKDNPTLFSKAISDGGIENINSDDYKAYKEIYIKVIEITALLHVDNVSENSVAHYTRISTAEQLIFNDSPFRLNTILTANDPKEGLDLFEFLNLDETDNDVSSDFQAFIGSFTFNHDSLNQFRLYGKENDKEATGISLVFNDFFFNGSIVSCVNPSSKFDGEKIINGSNDEKSLFRCIYVDPISKQLISIGQREMWTFYRENRENIEKADKIIKSYREFIDEIFNNVKDRLNELKILIGKLGENKKVNVLSELLLMLRYLTKNMAFKEEQECRVVTIENITKNPNILPKKGDGDFTQMYINYHTVKDCIEKVYFAPKVRDKEMFNIQIKRFGLNIRSHESTHKIS